MTATAERPPASPVTRMLVLIGTAVIVGAAASFAAIALVDTVAALNRLLLVDPRARVQLEQQGWLLVAATLLVPCLGGLVVGALHHRLSPEARPLGPPDVIHAVQFGTAPPDLRSGAVSTATAALSLGVGASVGQYGPMVYLGAMIGGMLRKLPLGVPNLPAIAISCGVAAAIATAFNAPIAGLIFAHEVVLRHFATRAFAPVTVASATGYVIANLVFDRPPLFLVEFGGVAHEYEFALFAALGLCVAVLAVAFMRLLLVAGPVLAAWVPRPALRPAAAGTLLGLTALALPDVLGIGTEALRFTTIEGAFGTRELVILIVAKMAVTALCLGAGFSGGVFSPALLIGSLIGALFWSLTTLIAGGATSAVAVYAICGMMAFASAVIGAPLTCILIAFELTRNYDVTIAAMVAVAFSNLVSHRLFGRSYFDVQLARRGVDLSRGRDWARMAARPVRELIRTDVVTAPADAPSQRVAERLAQARMGQAFITAPDGTLHGVLAAGDARAGASAGDVAAPPGLVLHDDTSVATALGALRGFVGDAVPVVTRADGRYLGAVAEADLVAAWMDDSDRMRKEENAAL